MGIYLHIAIGQVIQGMLSSVPKELLLIWTYNPTGTAAAAGDNAHGSIYMYVLFAAWKVYFVIFGFFFE
jgi:hypothetical protein